MSKDKKIFEEKGKFDVRNHYVKSETSYSMKVAENPLGDPYLWNQLKPQLTENQRKWLQYYVIENMSVNEIAGQENVSTDAVKSWGRGVRKKLKIAVEQRGLERLS
ncbi:RNA polymerase sigma factor [Virgibacillus necropolis]|uniref:RNA polymerase sigma factor 70 region 4 type 2 domain-containing protein n=1 Tax=Virgibacillus necropolis TaxID=163877 RepID=A0A221MA53_9BACI|nr:sigma-70 family RNA polymerase sigma factor [Virgibacillus necropolis]ASN04527.1 hypothetical protein CFK40_05630 [Virgibacillus necropolis]